MSSPEKIRVAIAGLGAAAREIHLPAYARLPEIDVVGGFDPAPRQKFPFPVFDSFEAMLERSRPDLVAVVTPTAFHFDLTAAALRAGCHVLCEKPFMPTLPEAWSIIDLARQMKRWVVVNNQYRFMNIHEAAKQRIGTPEFGDLLFLNAQQTFFTSEKTEAGWRGQDPQRTCKEFGIHVLDLARFFFGEDPSSIRARMPKVGRDGPDYLNLIHLEFSNDRVAQITLDRLARGPHRYLNMALDGSAGWLETNLGGGIEFNAGIRGGGKRVPYVGLDVTMGGRARLFHGEKHATIARDPIDLFAHATSKLLRAFVTALRDGSVPPCHAADNVRTLGLMLAAYESAERGQTIEMRYEAQPARA
jgi:predicted dehydrogenase